MSDELAKAIETVRAHLVPGSPLTHEANCAAWTLAKAYLSPPAAGPGFDAADFLERHYESVLEWERIPFGGPSYEEMTEPFLAELRAAMGAGEDEGEAVTEEWLRSVGLTTAPNSAYVRIASKDNAVAVRLATGEVEIYDNVSMEMCRVHGVTRKRMRSLCTALGIPLPAAPGERSGE